VPSNALGRAARAAKLGRALQVEAAMRFSQAGSVAALSAIFSGFLWVSGGTAQAQVSVEPLRQQVTERKFGARIDASTTSYAGKG
jgi:hypothetical protein